MLKDTHTEAVCPALSAGLCVTIKGIPNSSVNVSMKSCLWVGERHIYAHGFTNVYTSLC